MPRLRLFLFGSPRIELDGQPVKVETRKTIALLAFLGMTGESYRRDSLVNLFWPEYDPTHGRGVLRRTLSALNAVLPEGWVKADRETIGLDAAADLWLDVCEFNRLLAECRRHSHPDEEVCQDCQNLLAQAAALYRDDFMSGFSLPDSFNFDDWQFFQAEGLRQGYSAALKKLVRCLILRADYTGAIEQARRRLALDRLNEEAHRDLMLLYAWSGQRTAALRQFQECQEALKGQLGIEPQKISQDLSLEIETGRIPAPPAPAFSGTAPSPAGSVGTPPQQDTPHEQDTTGSLPPAPTIEMEPQPKGTSGAPRLEVEEKRILTILVCEICREDEPPSTLSLNEEEAPEESGILVERFLALARPILDPYKGQIQRWMGGSVLVVFGLGQSHENDPELALRAALELRSGCQASGLCLTAGIATGEVYVRNQAAGEAENIILTGAALDQARHLSSHAASGLILAGESTYQLTRDSFHFGAPSVQTPRMGPPATAYQVENLLLAAHKTRGIEGQRSGLVGREKELGELRASVDLLLGGLGQLVALVGEAGVGKSRLVEELSEFVQAPDHPASHLLWLEGRCLEMGIDVSYWPFLDALRQYFAWSEAGGQDEQGYNNLQVAVSMQSLIAAGYLAADRGEEIASLLIRLLSQNPDQRPSDSLASQSPEEIRDQTFLAIRDFLFALARRQPVLLVFEDLHWADHLSLDLIAYLLDILPQCRVLLLCVYRPEAEYRTSRLAAMAERKCRGRFSEIRLHELSQLQSYQMMDSLLGVGSPAGRIKELIWERCQGNPFFIEEILGSLIDAGMIYRENEHWQVSPKFDSAQLPASIQSIILSRLDHIDEDWRMVLQTAAVIGRVFRRRILAQVLGAEIDLDKVIWELEGRGLIYQERAIPEEEFSFRHVLMQEAIYHNILRHRRKALHQRTAEAIEALYPRGLEDQAEQLAYHYEKSGNILQTIAYLYQAGTKAGAHYSNEAAITHLSKGLDLLRSLPETLERNRQELDFLILLGVPLVHSRGHAAAEVLETYQQARDLCLKTGDSAHLFMVLLGLRRYFFSSGKIQTAHDISRQMVDLARTHQSTSEEARAQMMLAEVLFRSGEFAHMVAVSQEGIALCQDQNQRAHVLLYGNDTLLGCQAFQAMGSWYRGQPNLARQSAASQLALSEALGHPFTHVFTLHFTADLYILLRDPLTVQRLVEELLQIAGEHGFALYQAWGEAQLGWALAAQGQVSAGIDHLQRGIEGIHRINVRLTLGTCLGYLGEALTIIGRFTEAMQAIDEGLTGIRQSGELEFEAELCRLKGEVLRQENHLEEAEACFTGAIEIARRQFSPAWELRAATSLARLWSAQGRSSEALTMLGPVYRRYREGFDTPDLLDARAVLDELSSA